jgi:hypothetical protein
MARKTIIWNNLNEEERREDFTESRSIIEDKFKYICYFGLCTNVAHPAILAISVETVSCWSRKDLAQPTTY